METVSIIAGVLVLCVTVVDVLATVVAVSGRAGPVTGHLALSSWRCLLRLHTRRPIHRVLRVGGVVLTIGTVLCWIAMLLVGWILVFVPGSIVGSATQIPAGFTSRLYYVGYTVFTLGNGDLVASTPAWRIATIAANGMGLVLVTLAVTYLIPIVQAVVDKRSVASAIANLGATTEGVLRQAWNGSDLVPLESQLAELALPIDTLAQQHLAYPNLHYQHATDIRSALAPQLVAVDDALTVLEGCGVDSSIIDHRRLEPLRRAIGNLIDTLEPVLDAPYRETLPVPSYDDLVDIGLPIGDRETFETAFDDRSDRRRMLASFLYHDGWDWDAVHARSEDVSGSESATGS